MPEAAKLLGDMARRAHPPTITETGGEWDVDGLMSIAVRNLRARVMIGLAMGIDRQMRRLLVLCPTRSSELEPREGIRGE